MSVRAYLLLDIAQGKAEEVALVLSKGTGVRAVDILEGPPDVIAVIEASGRQKLAQFTVRAVASVETLTRNLHLLPVQECQEV